MKEVKGTEDEKGVVTEHKKDELMWVRPLHKEPDQSLK